MKKTIYMLQHSYFFEAGNKYGVRAGYEAIKMLGLYSTRKKAEDAIEEYFCKEGFNLYSKECFSIDAYEIDCDTGWTSGFECRDGEYWLPLIPNNSDKSSNCTGPGSESSKIAIWKKYGENKV